MCSKLQLLLFLLLLSILIHGADVLVSIKLICEWQKNKISGLNKMEVHFSPEMNHPEGEIVQSSRKFFSTRSQRMQFPSVWLLSHPTGACHCPCNHGAHLWHLPVPAHGKGFPFPMFGTNSFHIWMRSGWKLTCFSDYKMHRTIRRT